MKILVCISNVPDTTTRIKLTEGNSKLDTTGIQWVINPWDELSLTRALELKDDEGIYGPIILGYPKANPSEALAKALDSIKPNKKDPVTKWI